MLKKIKLPKLFKVLLFGLIFLYSCDQKKPLQVIFITIDTLRADRLGCYGFEKNTTPNIDAFAAESTLFLNASSQSTFTTGSFSSLYTGRMMTESLVHGNRLNTTIRYLPEILKSSGFYNIALLANPSLTSDRGFDNGFDEYRMLWKRTSNSLYNKKKINNKMIQETDAEMVTQKVIDTLKSCPDKSLFFWVLYMDTHTPYSIHESQFYHGSQVPRMKRKPGMYDNRSMDQAELNYYYEGEIRYTDHHLGRLIKYMKTSGLCDQALIIFTSDHGENLKDHHDYIGHGRFAYQATAHVPLIIRWPDTKPSVVDQPVALVDLFPTILDYCGIEIHEGLHLRGSKLKPCGREIDKPILIEGYSSKHQALRKNQYKLILDRYQSKNSYSLYDVVKDTAEVTDRIDTDYQAAAKLQEELKQLRASLTPAPKNIPTPVLDDDTKKQLKILGYIN